MTSRDQLTDEKLTALLELLEDAEVLEPGAVADLKAVRELGDAREAREEHAPEYAVERRQK